MKFGLTLGGGGARGAAHVGVISELERLGLRPDLITGASIGSLIGALYAAGKTAAQLTDLLEHIGISQLFSMPGNTSSLMSNNKLEKIMEEAIGRISFAELQIPLALVTVDLVERKIIVLDEGDLISAVLASMALPVVLPPVERDGRLLIDGGVLNNVPFDVARARGATFVLAVDLTNTAPFGTPAPTTPATGGVIERMLSFTQRQRTWQILSTVTDIITGNSLNVRLAISQPELLLRPELGSIGLFDFHRWEEGVAAGKTAVAAHEETLRALLQEKQDEVWREP